MKQTKKRIIFAVAAVALLALMGLALYFKSIFDYKQAVSRISFQNIDLAQHADGTYIGECDVGVIYARVEVTVREGVITGIEILEHQHERGQAAEAVLDEIVAQQSIEVDAIAGATNSSTVLKKAVENALASSDG